MIVVVASVKALNDLREMNGRGHVRARLHPDGGVWMSARSARGDEIVNELAERYGTKSWGAEGWRVRRAQLRLPGV